MTNLVVLKHPVALINLEYPKQNIDIFYYYEYGLNKIHTCKPSEPGFPGDPFSPCKYINRTDRKVNNKNKTTILLWPEFW